MDNTIIVKESKLKKVLFWGSLTILVLFLVVMIILKHNNELTDLFLEISEQNEDLINESTMVFNSYQALDKEIIRLERELVIANDFIKAKDDEIIRLNDKLNGNSFGYTQSEIYAIAKMVEAEVGAGGTDEHLLLVANVINNRVQSKKFPNTTFEVLFQYGIRKDNGKIVFQFSPIGDNRYFYSVPSERTKDAVNRMISGEDNSDGALFFMNPKYSNPEYVEAFEKSYTYITTIQGHKFYR